MLPCSIRCCGFRSTSSATIVGLLSWNIAGAVCDARQAKRLFALFVSAGILGSVIGNFITGPLAQILGTPNLLILYAAVLFVSAWFARSIMRHFFQPIAKHGETTSFIAEVRAGFDYVRASSLFKLMAVGSVLFSILYFSIWFPFSTAVSASFSTEAEVAGFLGVFSGIATALTFFVSLFVASRLYARIGVVNAVLLLPIAYLAGFVLFALNFSLINAALARLLQLIVLGGIAGTAYSTFFNVVPADKRGQVRSFDSGVPEQIGVVLSGVLLILGQRVLTTTQIFIMGMLGSIVCGALVWRLRRNYGQASARRTARRARRCVRRQWAELLPEFKTTRTPSVPSRKRCTIPNRPRAASHSNCWRGCKCARKRRLSCRCCTTPIGMCASPRSARWAIFMSAKRRTQSSRCCTRMRQRYARPPCTSCPTSSRRSHGPSSKLLIDY